MNHGIPTQADTNLTRSRCFAPMRYLLVEDNDQLANAVLDRLTLDGHVVDRAPDLGTADDFIATTEYDMILLDIMLPDGGGISGGLTLAR